MERRHGWLTLPFSGDEEREAIQAGIRIPIHIKAEQLLDLEVLWGVETLTEDEVAKVTFTEIFQPMVDKIRGELC